MLLTKRCCRLLTMTFIGIICKSDYQTYSFPLKSLEAYGHSTIEIANYQLYLYEGCAEHVPVMKDCNKIGINDPMMCMII